MKKIILIIILILLLVVMCGCSYRSRIDTRKEVQIITNVMTSEENEGWTPDSKYIVITRNLELATDSLYKVGDTIKIE